MCYQTTWIDDYINEKICILFIYIKLFFSFYQILTVYIRKHDYSHWGDTCILTDIPDHTKEEDTGHYILHRWTRPYNLDDKELASIYF